MFIVEAVLFKDTPVRIQWEDGKFQGTSDAMSYLQSEMKAGRVVCDIPGMGWVGLEIEKSEVASWSLVLQLFDNVRLIGGKVPAAPSLPEGYVS